MKNTNRVEQNHSTVSAFPQGKTTTAAISIGKTIGLSEKEIKALALISEWEHLTLAEYCNSNVLGGLQASFDDMTELAKDENRPAEKAWAEKFLPSVSPLFRKLQSLPQNPPSAETVVKTRGDIAAEEKAAKAALWSAISDFELITMEANSLLRLMSNTFEFLTTGGDISHAKHDQKFSAGVCSMASSVEHRLAASCDSLIAAYRLLK